jgi:Rab GDP dissociation inhibitor
MTCNEIFKKYGISDSTKDFLGHAVALYTSDDYLELNSKGPIEKM